MRRTIEAWIIIFLALMTLTISPGCGDNYNEQALQTKIDTLEQYLENCENGEAHYYSIMAISFVEEDYDHCISIYKEVVMGNTKWLPHTKEARKLYKKALEFKEKKREDKKIASQLEKEQRNEEYSEKRAKSEIKVFAEAYADGIVSCNLMLVDDAGKQYRFEAGSYGYTIYDRSGHRLYPTENDQVSSTSYEIYIDITLGQHVYNAHKIEFEYTFQTGENFKSGKVLVDRDY